MEKESFRLQTRDGDEGKRIDKYLSENLSHKFSRSFIQKLVRGGAVLVDGEPVKKPHHKIGPGEMIDIAVPEVTGPLMKPEEIPLDIVYEDEDVLVVNKPCGMVVHPAPGNYSGTLANALLAHCKNLSGISGVLKPGIVHRLDKGTSGLLVVAKTDEAHKALARQFKDKTIKRVYVALAKGVVQLDNGVIELPIGRSVRDRKKMAVVFSKSKYAATRYKVVKRFEDFTLIELVLATGRTHQIRVHMAYIGHPILGDDKYGTKAALSHPALHAKTLGFVHPITKKYMEFTTPIPKDMNELIQKGHV